MKVTFSQLKEAFNQVLLKRGVAAETADACADMFARTTESGVYSHGVNRFPRFIQQLDNGDIIPEAKPQRITSLGAIEQWDAQRSIGNLTAKKNDGPGDGTGIRSRHWAGGAAERQPLDARGELRLAGGGKRLHRHLLDQLHRRDAAVGRQRMPYRYQPADRRHSFHTNHHGGYVDVDVLLRHAGGEPPGGP
ncbi:hypothetical protein BN1200_80025 [Klebsiella variicola]|nr:hypothetical protein BN1200_80025 [Klebsiella variicola]